MAESKSSGKTWVWISLLVMLGLFTAGIFYLDRQIVNNSKANAKQPEIESDKQKPKIDFYTVLEDRVIDIPVSEDDVDGLNNPSINKQAVEKFTLQAGSFKSASDADSLKAELAFLGLEAKVHSANVNGSTWHRVVLGPFASNSKISRAKNLLLENGIQYVQRTVVE